jgi:predicted nuclease of predicted toxin-antitoxin system
MKFVADENIDQPVISRLRTDGHEILAVFELNPGIADDIVLGLANHEGVVLLTGDKDFGELVFRDRRYAFGIVLIRLSGLPVNDKVEIVTKVIKEHAGELAHAFTVITARNVRIRPRVT